MWFSLFLASAFVLTFAIPIRLLFWAQSNVTPEQDSDRYASRPEDGAR